MSFLRKMERSKSIKKIKEKKCSICQKSCSTKYVYLKASYWSCSRNHTSAQIVIACALLLSTKRCVDAAHEGKKPHECSICDLSTANMDYLKKHIEADQNKRKPHKCAICD